MQFVIILSLVAIVISLGQALAAMSGPGQSTRMARALTVRIGLSIGLFVLLFVGNHFGWIEPHKGF